MVYGMSLDAKELRGLLETGRYEYMTQPGALYPREEFIQLDASAQRLARVVVALMEPK